MRDRLEEFYEQELFFIRQLAAEFARDRPKIADRLLVAAQTGESSDPHVERLIESFAFLTARVRLKIEDEFPELTNSLLELLYPHYLAPFPSASIAQFHLDPSQSQLTDGYTVPRHSPLSSRHVRGVPCRFRTAYPVTLWPLQLAQSYLTAPFGTAVKLPPGLRNVEAMIRLELQVQGNVPLSGLQLDRLRVCLRDDERTAYQLYELLFNNCVGVYVREAGGGASKLLPASTIQEVGFGRDEGLLPYDARCFLGYRLLTEYFAFPQKFLFADFTGLREVVSRAKSQKIELCVLLNKADRTLESRVDPLAFRLGCTPIVNLFPQRAEPIRLTQTRTEYPVIPDIRHRRAFEVYSVDSVASTNLNTGEATDYQPYFACRHGSAGEKRLAYWYSRRTPSPLKNDPGTDVELALVDVEFNPHLPPVEVLSVTTTCTNRDLPGDLRTSGGESWGLPLDGQAPVRRIDPILPPTLPCRLPAGEARWRLISHLSLNHLSISEGNMGADALREILKLYDYKNSRVTMQQITGIESVSSRRKTARVSGGAAAGFCRGVEVEVTFDPEQYAGVGAYLLSSVLDKFVALYASVNSFSRLVTRMRNSPDPFRVWPCRVGEQMTL